MFVSRSNISLLTSGFSSGFIGKKNNSISHSGKNYVLISIMKYIEKTKNDMFFYQVVKKRISVIKSKVKGADKKNIYQLITSNEARSINGVLDLNGMPKEAIIFERMAINHFGNILLCWVEFELFRIIQRYKNSVSYTSSENKISFSENIYFEVVSTIENDERLFLTHHCPFAMTLPDAIVYIVLETLVKRKYWFEILFTLNLSRKGKHIILYNHTDSGSPIIACSALIQSVFDKKKWVYFDSFFTNSSWCSQINSRKIHSLNCLKSLHGDLEFSYLEDNINEFNEKILEKIGCNNKVVEVLRFTVSGNRLERREGLYYLQKKLIKYLNSKSVVIAFIITEQTGMLRFYDSINRESKSPELSFISVSYQEINRIRIYKGLWLVNSLNKFFDNETYEDYINRIINNKHRLYY